MIRAVLAVACLAAVSVAVAGPCTPDPAYTPTPTVRWDHNLVGVALFRVYAQRGLDTSWPWHADFVVWPGDADSAVSAPGVTLDVPVQRVVPTAVQAETVRVMVKAVSPTNVESGPSNIIDICMPLIWQGGAYR